MILNALITSPGKRRVRSAIRMQPFQQTLAMLLARALAGTNWLDRAETVVRSITDLDARVTGLTALAKGIAAAGALDRARQAIEQAETATRSVESPAERAECLAELIEAHAAAGALDRVRQIAEQATAVAGSASSPVSLALVSAGDLEGAESVTRSLEDPAERARCLAELANAHAVAGALDRARQIAEEAETTARSLADSVSPSDMLAMARDLSVLTILRPRSR